MHKREFIFTEVGGRLEKVALLRGRGVRYRGLTVLFMSGEPPLVASTAYHKSNTHTGWEVILIMQFAIGYLKHFFVVVSQVMPQDNILPITTRLMTLKHVN
jgi:hypothetical protein